MPYETAKQRN